MVTSTGTFNGTGADASGASGDENRVLTLSNTGVTSQGGFLVYASGLALALTTDYTVEHNTTGTEVTFLNRLWDDMTVVVNYIITTTPDVVDNRLDERIDYFGTPITVVSPTGNIYTDDWGNQSYNTSSRSMTVVLNDVTGEEAWNTEGIFVRGDKILFLKSYDDLSADDEVIVGSDKYRVVGKPVRHNIQDANQQKEVPIKRIESDVV